MAWNPKTIAGKLLKTTLTVGKGVLGLATGINLGSAAVGATVAAVAKGTNALTKVGTVLSNTALVVDKVSTASKSLQTGITQKVNAAVNAEKKAGQDLAAELDGTVNPSQTTGGITDYLKGANSKYLLIAGGVVAALFILPKLLKGRR